MSTEDQPTDTDQQESPVDLKVFDGFDPLSCAKSHHCVPDVAKSTNTSIRVQLRWIQERTMQTDPVVQQILMRLVHEKTQETQQTSERWQMQEPSVRAELQKQFGNYNVRDDF